MTLGLQSETEIVVGHSPDADDAFMFYALTSGKIDTGPYVFRHALHDIETLNRKALTGEFPITAVSVASYPDIANRYLMMHAGGSFGDGYGPVVVSRRPMSLGDLFEKKVAVPGRKTSAFLALSMAAVGFYPVVVPFDQIMAAVSAGECDAGLLIHEGQITYKAEGFHLIADLGIWWEQTAELPLPLGVNVVRNDLGAETIRDMVRLTSESIAYALAHKEEAVEHAMNFSRGLSRAQTDQFVGMYVNDLTVDMGYLGECAIIRFLQEAAARRLTTPVRVLFA